MGGGRVPTSSFSRSGPTHFLVENSSVLKCPPPPAPIYKTVQSLFIGTIGYSLGGGGGGTAPSHTVTHTNTHTHTSDISSSWSLGGGGGGTTCCSATASGCPRLLFISNGGGGRRGSTAFTPLPSPPPAGGPPAGSDCWPPEFSARSLWSDRRPTDLQQDDKEPGSSSEPQLSAWGGTHTPPQRVRRFWILCLELRLGNEENKNGGGGS